MKEVVSTWLIRSYKKQFKESTEIKIRLEVYGFYIDVECDPSNVDFVEWLASKFSNHMKMDWYTKNALWLYWIRGDDEEEIYLDLRHMMIIRMHGSMNGIEKSRGLKKNHGWMMKLRRNLMMKYVMNYEGLEDGDLKDEALKKAILEGSWGHENREGKNFCSWLKECFGNYHELDYELMKKLEEYWMKRRKDLRKEKSKLLGMPYEKPPTFKLEMFEVIKYSLGPEEEYVSIKEYEYDIWLRTKENASCIYEEIFHKKDKGWSVTRTK
ncbi:hypothetical protein Tco_1062209 [Tanacetum coccineum]